MHSRELMERYLARLGIARRPAATWESLQLLVAAHLESIAFENLDVVAGLRPQLSTEGTLHKIAVRGRGGFCYELNEAFRALLEDLGFVVRRIEARVWSQAHNCFGPPFDHLALVVQLPEGEFLTDVGFGDNNRKPLRLPQDTLTDLSGHYTLARQADGQWLLSRPDRLLYTLSLGAQPLEAFEPMYRYHQSSPESLFAQGLICTRATASGRITVSGDRLTIIDGTHRRELAIADRNAVLQEFFGAKEPLC